MTKIKKLHQVYDEREFHDFIYDTLKDEEKSELISDMIIDCYRFAILTARIDTTNFNKRKILLKIWNDYIKTKENIIKDEEPLKHTKTKLNKNGTPRKIIIKKYKESQNDLSVDKGTLEELKQFWNHNINPITGFKATINKREIYHHTNYWLDKTKD